MGLVEREMPTYAEYGGWLISTIAGRFQVTADTLVTIWPICLVLATRSMAFAALIRLF